VPDTFIKIASVTVGSGGASSIDFTSIPSTYTDLCVKLSVSAATSNGFQMTINGSSSNFTYRLLEGDGAAAASYNGTTGRIAYAFSSATIFSNVEVYIPNYAGSTNKSFSTDGVSEQNATTAYADLTASLWSQTAAINALGFNFSAGNIRQYSTATLYGIKNS
jgi:hypothetical protein